MQARCYSESLLFNIATMNGETMVATDAHKHTEVINDDWGSLNDGVIEDGIELKQV